MSYKRLYFSDYNLIFAPMSLAFNFKRLNLVLIFFTLCIQCNFAQSKKKDIKAKVNMNETKKSFYSKKDTTAIQLDNEQLKQILPSDVFNVARNKGTEYAFSGKYWNHFEAGTYGCAVCGNSLFKSDAKFESSCGWPSFFEPIKDSAMHYYTDKTHGMSRVEVTCGRCESHLGHIFDDGPPPSYKRYCINSVVIDFDGKNEIAKDNVSAKLDTLAYAYFGGGCFWCVEAQYQLLNGVTKVESGYAGGQTLNPTYKEVCSGNTGHAEIIKLTYNPTIITYDELLEAFWQAHDPTTLNRQGNDVGTQYRSVIFYSNKEEQSKALSYMEKLNQEKVFDNPIVTEISALPIYYPAENYHQNYYKQNGSESYCMFVVKPKVDKFKKIFQSKIK
jgi:peptide methionine sulfoxide reductase msrA/msrB